MTEEQYLKKLEVLLKAAQDEYKQITYDRRAMQHGILRHYTWISTALFGGQVAALFKVAAGEVPLLNANVFFLVFICGAAVVSAGTFCYAVDTLRGRGETRYPYAAHFVDLVELADREYHNAPSKTGSEIKPQDLYISMTADLQAAIEANRATAESVGIKLRRFSRLLTASITTTVLAILVALF